MNVGEGAKSATMAETAYNLLKADILTCRLRPNAKLLIGPLTEEHGISLSGVREALSRLTAEGFVLAEPQKGYRVAPVSTSDLKYLTAARIDIENLCLVKSIDLGGVEWETAVVATFHRLSRTPYWEENADGKKNLNREWSSAHSAFHEALVSGANNPWLSWVRNTLYLRSERYRWLSVPLFDAERDVASEHKALSDACLARNVDLATKLMGEHLNLTTKIILDGLDKAPNWGD